MNKTIQKAIRILLIILVLTTIGFFIYTSDYYPADEKAQQMITKSNLTVNDDFIFMPGDDSLKTALLFYPGGKVEAIAYLPLLEKIRESTVIPIYILQMPFRLAVFDINAADKIIETNPQYEHWIIAGHSLGGAMASQFAAENQESIAALILLGAYPYKDYPENSTLTIYGSLEKEVAAKIETTENVVAIEGGNHAQFGNYGEQKGDATATIKREAQQKITVENIVRFLSKQGFILE